MVTDQNLVKKMLLIKKGTFSAAHFLPNYNGKCSNIHGHTWIYEVRLKGHFHYTDPQNYDGIWLDFEGVKNIMEQYDHLNLNDFFTNPTCEIIALTLGREIVELFPQVKDITLALLESNKAGVIVDWKDIQSFSQDLYVEKKKENEIEQKKEG